MSTSNNIHILALQHAGGVLGGKCLIPLFVTSSRTFLHSSIVPLLMNFSSSASTISSSASSVLISSGQKQQGGISLDESRPSSTSSSSPAGDNFFLRSDQDQLLRLFGECSTLQFASKLTFDSSNPELIQEILVQGLVKDSRYGARSITSLRLSAISTQIVETLAKLPALKILDLGGCNKLYDRTLMNMGTAFDQKKHQEKQQQEQKQQQEEQSEQQQQPLSFPAPRLSRLNLANDNMITFQGFKFIVSFAKNLSYLNVSSCMGIDSNCMKVLYCERNGNPDSFSNANFFRPEGTQDAIKNNNAIRELNLNCTSVSTLEFLPYLRNLYKLEISSCTKLRAADLKFFAEYASRAEKNLKKKTNEKQQQEFEEQQEEKDVNSSNSTPSRSSTSSSREDEETQSIITTFEEINPLHELNISANKELWDEPMTHLKDSLPFLRVLNMSHCTRLTDACLTDTISQASFANSLRYLSLAGNTSMTNVGFGSLSTLSALQVLNVSNTNLTNLEFVKTMKELRVLNCFGCEKLTDISGIGDLSVYQTLKILSLHYCQLITDDQLKHLSRLCVTSLQRLDLSFCIRVSQFGVQYLVSEVRGDAKTPSETASSQESSSSSQEQHCSLRELSVAQCRRINDLSMMLLMKNLEMLNASGTLATHSKKNFKEMFPLVKIY